MSSAYPVIWDPTTTPSQRSATAGDTILGAFANPEQQSANNGEAGPIVVGTPVYFSAVDTVKKAKADASATANVVALVADASITAGNPGNIITTGPLSATTTQWDAVAGTTGGLVFNTKYWLDPATAGKITATPPGTAGQIAVEIGTAKSTTVLDIKIHQVQIV